jgi:hypothetical protein
MLPLLWLGSQNVELDYHSGLGQLVFFVLFFVALVNRQACFDVSSAVVAGITECVGKPAILP